MPAKAVLEKKAWAWASKRSLDRISEEDLKTAYRINFPACKPGICRYKCESCIILIDDFIFISRKNCSGNPNCFNHLQSFQAGLNEHLYAVIFYFIVEQTDSEDNNVKLKVYLLCSNV